MGRAIEGTNGAASERRLLEDPELSQQDKIRIYIFLSTPLVFQVLD